MGRPTFNFNRWMRAALSIAGSDEVTNRPASNLRLPHPSDIWETVGTTSLFVEIETTAAAALRGWNTLGMLYHNATEADTWRIRTATTQGNLTAAPALDSGSISIITGETPDDAARIGASLVRPGIFRAQTIRQETWLRIDFTVASPLRVGILAVDVELIGDRPIRRDVQIGVPTQFEAEFWSEQTMLTLQEILVTYPEGPLLVLLDPDDQRFLHHRAIWGLRRRANTPRERRHNVWTQRWTITPYLPV